MYEAASDRAYNLLAERRDGHALDHMCDSLRFVASGIGEWLHDGWHHS